LLRTKTKYLYILATQRKAFASDDIYPWWAI